MAKRVSNLTQILPRLTERYGTVRGFCDADDVCYADMHPSLSWERTKTLGYGYDVCDFKIRVIEG